MIAVDNSDYSRNGDYAPSRWAAQSEAVGFLANAKLQENQESSVGLMTMAGSRINVLISPGREAGQLLSSLAKDVRVGGRSNFLAALKTAQLALKNRQNKNQRQRVIMFVASPIESSSDELVKLGKMFKKNNVALDVINFGTENTSNDNTEKLEALVATVNSSDNSHLVSIPPGPHIFADLVLTSSIMQGGGGAAMGGAGGAGASAAAFGGVDPNMDPEMAMAIRMSMEEERQRQQRAAGEAGGAGAAAPDAGGAAPMATGEEDEEALLAQAIALSMQEQNVDMSDAQSGSASSNAATSASSSAATTSSAAEAQPSAQDIDMAMQDPDFINSLLSGVPGAEAGQIDNLLNQLTGSSSASGSSGTSESTSSEAKKDEKKEGDKK